MQDRYTVGVNTGKGHIDIGRAQCAGTGVFYTVTVRLREETPESIGEARRALDSFRILDTSAGICKKMEDEVFHGYYGKNYVMTNCLVLLEEDVKSGGNR